MGSYSFHSWLLLSVFVMLTLTGCSHGNQQEKDPANGIGTESVPKIVVVVLSQPDAYHVARAEAFREHFMAQDQDLSHGSDRVRLLFAHEHLVDWAGSWNIINLVSPLMEVYEEESFDWAFVCEDETRIDPNLLLKLLATYDHKQKLFLGRSLQDSSTTIIHHFAFADNPSQFSYPDVGAGFGLSIGLLKRLHDRLESGKMKTDFTIDAKHEFALFVWEDGNGTTLTNVPRLCFADESSRPDCITQQPIKFPACGTPVPKEDLFVAVKTCHKFHDTRLPVVKATWAKQASDIVFYSEVEDKAIPTVNIHVPNTERGHCGKTMAIIRRVVANQGKGHPWWLLIADDDTIINLDRLRLLLACYKHRHPIALGERYGYGLFRSRGYDYITGGGGMVFNLAALKLLTKSCRCYSDDAPDDMTLGMCLKSIGIPVTHSRYFHQARPSDYSQALLSNQHPVAFHKHWETDPYEVYQRISTPVLLEEHTAPAEQHHAEEGNESVRRDEL